LALAAATAYRGANLAEEGNGMRTTVVGLYEDFAAASRASAALMKVGFAQAEISIVGREAVEEGTRFAFAGSLARTLAGAREADFNCRLVEGLARLGVPPGQAARHAEHLRGNGGLVAIQTDVDRAQRGETVMAREGVTLRYRIGAFPLRGPAPATAELAA